LQARPGSITAMKNDVMKNENADRTQMKVGLSASYLRHLRMSQSSDRSPRRTHYVSAKA
jgi:hypothetical protein